MGEMLACVRSSGLKLTPQRMAIVRELAADPTHPTAQELYERLRLSMPTMSFATVYNTLDALAAAGLCAALSLAPGPARFDPNMAAHHHAVCDRCGLVRDVPRLDGGSARSVHDGGSARSVHDGGSAPKPPERADLDGGAGEGDGSLEGVAPGFEIRAVERIYRGTCAECVEALARGGAGSVSGRNRRGALPSSNT